MGRAHACRSDGKLLREKSPGTGIFTVSKLTQTLILTAFPSVHLFAFLQAGISEHAAIYPLDSIKVSPACRRKETQLGEVLTGSFALDSDPHANPAIPPTHSRLF